MKFVLTESRDHAKKLAAPFEWVEQEGYIEVAICSVFPNGAIYSWARGNLVQLAKPEAYDKRYEQWMIEDLPIIPETFRYRVQEGEINEFSIIKHFLHDQNVSEIIIATDPGNGEYLAGLILMLADNKKPVKRLFTNSLTKNSVLHAYSNLLPVEMKKPLFYEAQARDQADWLIGINTSRAYTLAINQKGTDGVFACGRIQTPLLGTICKRELEIESYTPEKYSEVIATFSIQGITYTGKWFKGDVERLEKIKAEKLAQYCNGKHALVREIVTKEQEYEPPLLFNLCTLQMTANRLYKISPHLVLEVCKSLYVKGYVTYPATDSQYITEDEAKCLPEICARFSEIPDYQEFFPLPIRSIIQNSRYVKRSKAGEHHAILPTEAIPVIKDLSIDEQRVYDLIVKSVLSAHYHDTIIEFTTAITLVDRKFSFISKGRRVISEGWQRILAATDLGDMNGEDEIDTLLPHLPLNEEGRVTDCGVTEGSTWPPQRYSEGDLIFLMNYAARGQGDPQGEQVTNEAQGIGTVLNRSSIIEALKDSGLIETKNNLVFPTKKGRYLIEVIGDSVLSNTMLTARWEDKFREIGAGKLNAESFMDQVKKLTRKLVEDVIKKKHAFPAFLEDSEPTMEEASDDSISSLGKAKNNNTIYSTDCKEKEIPSSNLNNKDLPAPLLHKHHSEFELGICVRCGSSIIDKGRLYGCAAYPKCDFSISKTILGQSITEEDVRALLAGEVTRLIRGLKKRDRSDQFDACLMLEEGKLTFRYPSTRDLLLPLQLLNTPLKPEGLAIEHKKEITRIEKEASALKYPGKVVGVTVGPRVTRYELLPSKGVNYSSYKRFKNNFQAVLRAEKITMHIPIPGKNTIGIEVPNQEPNLVYLRSLLENKEFLANRKGLTFPLGADIEGNPVFGDLSKMPHLLVAGTTGSGKSVFINSVICSLLFSYGKEELQFVFIDPKQVELSAYETLPHLLMPIVKDPRRAGTALDKLIHIMMQRYDKFDAAGVKNIGAYNQKQKSKGEPNLPFIVLVIDELADLLIVADNRVEEQVQRLAQLARAAGIHMLIATQRPSKQCLSPVIKSNLPVRVAFSVAGTADSMTILDTPGAEDLLGKGDMLYQSSDVPLKRIQSAYVSDEEIHRVVRVLAEANQ